MTNQQQSGMPRDGRPKIYGEDTRSVTTRVPVSLYKRLKAYAKDNNITRSQALVALLKRALKLK